MRKNCGRTFVAWLQDDSFGKQGDSIWTDGDTIYSYDTWIVTRDYSAVCEEPSWGFYGAFTENGRPIWTCSKCSDYWCANPGLRFLFNATKYSQTTTTHQNAIREYMDAEGYHLKVHDNVPMGTTQKIQPTNN